MFGIPAAGAAILIVLIAGVVVVSALWVLETKRKKQ